MVTTAEIEFAVIFMTKSLARINEKSSIQGAVYKVYGLRLGPNFEVRLTAENNFYLRLTAEKMHAFGVFAEKYLRLYGYNGTNFTATVNCTNPKTLNLFCDKNIISPF